MVNETRSWLHLMGELSPKVTEGEKPLSQNPKT